MIKTISTLALIFLGAASSQAYSSKTVTVTETVQYYDDSTGKVNGILHSDVWIEPSKKIDIVVHMDGMPSPIGIYLVDGQTEYDYNRGGNFYFEQPYVASNPPYPGQVRDLTKSDLLLTGLVPPKSHGIKRKVTKAVLDGQEMNLTVDTTDKSRVSYWVNSKTLLPYRVSTETLKDGKWVLGPAVNFSDWKFDISIPESQFVWTVPEGATWSNKPEKIDFSML